jgi:hypothetical protein
MSSRRRARRLNPSPFRTRKTREATLIAVR